MPSLPRSWNWRMTSARTDASDSSTRNRSSPTPCGMFSGGYSVTAEICAGEETQSTSDVISLVISGLALLVAIVAFIRQHGIQKRLAAIEEARRRSPRASLPR